MPFITAPANRPLPPQPGSVVKDIVSGLSTPTVSPKSTSRISDASKRTLRNRQLYAKERLYETGKISSVKGGKSRRRKTKKRGRQSWTKRS